MTAGIGASVIGGAAPMLIAYVIGVIYYVTGEAKGGYFSLIYAPIAIMFVILCGQCALLFSWLEIQ
jgi:hypothetical protein